MAEKKSYWNQIHLKYLDELEIIQVLDAPTIRRLENGDEELLQQIRKNVEESGMAEAAQQPACIEEKTLACTSVDNLEFEDEASNSDLEENTVDSQPISWTREATELLISLYEEHEEELENPRNKKKDIWKKITAELNEAGYKYVQSKVEGKWRSLLASHKDLSLNKKRTGQKRKTFQYFEKIDNIIAKRHDINPPFTSESSKQKETKFSTKVDKNMTSCTSSQTDEESSTVSNDISSFSPSSTDTPDINSDSGKNVNAENTETPLNYLSKLPPHILDKIFMHVQKVDLHEVCKDFRNYVYYKRTDFVVHVDALSVHCGIKFMPNLKKLTITALNNCQEIALIPVIELFIDFEFKNLEILVLKNFSFENSLFSAFTEALSHVKLSALQFVTCDEVTLGQLKCILEQIKTLKFCDIQCNLENVVDKHVFAELANQLVGEVNFNLNSLEMVPSSLLRHRRADYRALWPKGQSFL
ncbi:uncharacterized protein LOC134229893 isoform X1 [Saccostrea cucullata]|uniref:uncharacterized protein LOC134229893 isoform X1 n=1 Tax=Saccostrea cuccullata TaxID=36930 RepID=UPI002ED201D8